MKKGRVFLSVLAIALAIALIGGMTASLFTDSTTVESSFKAGTVEVEAGEVGHCECVDIGNMKPGDTARGCFDVTNIGTLPFTFEVVLTETAGDLFGGTHPAVVTILKPSGELDPEETTKVCYTVFLPCEAGNEYQGTTGSLELTVTATQILGSCGEEEPDTYTVTFESNGGSDVGPIGDIPENGTISNLPVPILDGSNFMGWFTDNGTFADEFTENTPVIADITVYAAWEAETVGNCTITVHASPPGIAGVGFTGQGGLTTFESSTVSRVLPQGTTVTLIAPYQVYAVYIFDGWSEGAPVSLGGTISIDPNPWQWYNPPSAEYQYPLNSDVVLYANYRYVPPGPPY